MNESAGLLSETQRHRTPPVVWALALAGPLVLLGPMLAQGQVLFWGTPLLQFAPWHSLAVDIVRHGGLPLWNPFLGAGAPLLANYQSALLYPPNWLLLIVTPAWGHGLLLLFHLMWTAAGMVLLARALGARPLGQLVAAQAWSLSPFLVSRSAFLSLEAAVAWLPWVVLVGIRLGREVSSGLAGGRVRRALLGFGVVVALQLLAGHAQITWYGLVLTSCLVLVVSSDSRAGWLRGVAALAMGLTLALGLSAAQILPTAEYLMQSSRASGLDSLTATTYSFWPWRTLGLLLPDLFGSPAAGDFWGYGNYWEDALYVGLLPLLMAATAMVKFRRFEGERRRLAVFLAAGAFVAFLLALGSNAPVFPWLYRWVPTFDMFNAPARWNVATTMCLALLASMGADLWSSPTPRGRYWKHLAVAGAFAIVAAGFAARALAVDLRPSLPRAFETLGFWAMSAVILQLSWPERVDQRWWVLVGLVVAADLLAADVGLVPSTSPRLYTESTGLRQRVDDGHRLYMPPSLEYEVKFERSHRFDTFHPGIDWLDVREAALPNTSMLASLPTFNNFDPLLAADYSDWVDLLDQSQPALRERLLALADVGWLGEDTPGSPLGVNYREVATAARVRIVPEARLVANRGEALAGLASAAADPASVVWIESQGILPARTEGGEGEAEVIGGGDPNTVVVRAVAEAGGWLLLSDAWYPGWVVEVDGSPVDLYRADGLFRAVWIPPGEHVAQFDYRPWIFALGVLVSSAAWCLVFFLVRRW